MTLETGAPISMAAPSKTMSNAVDGCSIEPHIRPCVHAATMHRNSTEASIAGFQVLRPQPRGIGQSHGPLTGIDLHDYAADVAAVIAHADKGAAFVVGHAFGNRVARMLATDRPELVRAVGLVAANIGKAPSPPQIRVAIRSKSDAPRPSDGSSTMTGPLPCASTSMRTSPRATIL